MHTGSDGNVYFGSMPHHPTQGTDIWRYDTREGKLVDLASSTKSPATSATVSSPA